MKNKKLAKEDFIIISIIVIIILIDQILKIWIQNVGEIGIFKVSQNTSAAYGVGTGSKVTYVATHIIVLGVILKFILTQNQFVDRKMKIFLSFILAGGISNVIDKIIRGYVTEFIDFGKSFPIFNIADVFVLIGWIAIAANFAVFTVNEWRENKSKKVLKEDNNKETK